MASRLIAAAAALLWMVGGFSLFLRLGHTLPGSVAATAAVYTGAVMLFAYGGGRRLRAYNPLDPRAIAVTPRLLALHVLFAGMVLGAECAMFSVKPALPSEWFAPHDAKGHTRYTEVLLTLAAVPCLVETMVARKVLARSFGGDWTD